MPTGNTGPTGNTDPTGNTGPTGHGVPAGTPCLAAGVRLGFDSSRGGPVLLAPESVTTLNDTGAAVVRLCDGTRTADEIAEELRAQWDDVDVKEVRAFINRLGALHCLRTQP